MKVVKSCIQCDQKYVFNLKRSFSKYCYHCSKKREQKQKRIEGKIKDYMKFKYGEI